MERGWATYNLPAEHFDRIWALAMAYLPACEGRTRADRIRAAVGQATNDYLEFLDGLDLNSSRPALPEFYGFLPGHLEMSTLNQKSEVILSIESHLDQEAPKKLPRWLKPWSSA